MLSFLNSSGVNQLTVFHPNSELNNTVVTQSPLTVYGLPAGTKITFSVTARAGGLEGVTVTVNGFTRNYFDIVDSFNKLCPAVLNITNLTSCLSRSF